MKMKVHKKLKRYDLAYKDSLSALGLMNEKQMMRHAELESTIAELKVSK